MSVTVLYLDSQLDRYVTRQVERGEVRRFSPCIEFADESRASWQAKHLNGECGRRDCPVCVEQREAKMREEMASVSEGVRGL